MKLILRLNQSRVHWCINWIGRLSNKTKSSRWIKSKTCFSFSILIANTNELIINIKKHIDALLNSLKWCVCSYTLELQLQRKDSFKKQKKKLVLKVDPHRGVGVGKLAKISPRLRQNCPSNVSQTLIKNCTICRKTMIENQEDETKRTPTFKCYGVMRWKVQLLNNIFSTRTDNDVETRSRREVRAPSTT